MSPVRLGIVGCGAIAQIQHLPNLATLREEFSVEAVCDVSPDLARGVAEAFHIPRWLTDYRELLACEVDAVLLCHTDPKTEVAIAAFRAGKHVFIEKPVCFSLQEMDAMLDAARAAGTVAQAGYMKVYDPAFERAAAAVARIRNRRFAQIHHYHTDNQHHLAQTRLQRGAKLPDEVIERTRSARAAAVHQAIGPASPAVEGAFFRLAGSMIHDLYGMRHVLGPARRVLHTDIWNDGWAFTTLVECDEGVRCAATWVELPHVRDFKETLEVCGDDRRVLLGYPTGFARGILSTLQLQELDENGHAVRSEPAVEWENAFVRELKQFHACITLGVPCRTPLQDARLDVALIIDIVRAHLDRNS